MKDNGFFMFECFYIVFDVLLLNQCNELCTLIGQKLMYFEDFFHCHYFYDILIEEPEIENFFKDSRYIKP